MSVPTYPDLWADILAQLNALLSWDPVKGFIVLSVAIFAMGLAMMMIGRIMHR